MDVANPWMHQGWDERKREMQENRQRRLSWMQRVMQWPNQELVKNEEVENSDEEDNEEDSVLDGEAFKDSGEGQNKESVSNQQEGDIFKECWGSNEDEMAEKWPGIDFQNIEVQGVDSMGIFENDKKEPVEANGGDEQDFGQGNRPDSTEFDCLSQNCDPFGASEEFKLNHGEWKHEEDEVSEQRLEDINMVEDLAMGGAEEEEEKEENEVQSMDSIPYEVHLEENDCSEDDEVDSTEYSQSEEDSEQQFEQENLSDSDKCSDSSKNSASSGSENGDLFSEESHNQYTEKAKDLDEEYADDLNGFEGLVDNSWPKRSALEELEEPITKSVMVESVASLSTNNDQLQDQPKEEEGESTDDDENELLGDEDADCYDQNEVKVYSQDNHPSKIFHTLKEFRDGFVLTDLELKTEDGKSIHVHSVVVAAVSYFVRKFLPKQQSWDKRTQLVRLGPEVEHEGLEAVVEFAYTGAIQGLNCANVYEVKTAARSLRAPRVVEVCERVWANRNGRNMKETVPAQVELRKNLQEISELWMKCVGCDITLDVLSASFQAHKVILAACSDYFRAMFTLGMKESSQSSVYLKFLSAPELEALIDCSYGGTVSLSWNCIFEITSTALQLQYQPVLDLCLNFLQQEINPHSCLDVASFAEAFAMVQLLEFAEDYILRQFQKVARTAKFKDLPARHLLKYLNSFALCVPSELVVFRAVVDWIQAKPKRRLRLAKELMKTIHFPLMTFREFKEVQTLKIWSDHSLQELYEAIFEDFCSNQAETQNNCRIYLPKESLVLSGGDQISEDLGTRSISKDMWFGNSLRNHTGIKKAMEWRNLGEMPQPARFSHEVAVLNGQLYVVGGKKYYGTGDTLSSVFRYDPLQNSWEGLASMHQERCSFSLVVLDAKLYAIGGQCHPDYIESVERYCPTANSWSFTCPLDLPLGGHVARVLQGQIFVSGGLNNDYQCLNSMFAYHPEKGSTYLEQMSRPRAFHCMEVLGDCLYVAGGISSNDNTAVVDALTCEMYNPVADSWTSFSPLPVPHVGAGSAVLEVKFYVLGGYSQEDYSDTKMVHRYDPATEQWENMGKMPGPNNDLRACVLCLPEHLRLYPD